MTELFLPRIRQLESRLVLLLIAITILASTLAVLVRYEQTLNKTLTFRKTVKANLAAMRAETKTILTLTSTLRQKMQHGATYSSDDALLYARLDQIKSDLQPSEMTISAKTTTNGIQSVGFTITQPAHLYPKTVNSMGMLQTETFPFVTFTGFVVEHAQGKAVMKIEGLVQLPVREAKK